MRRALLILPCEIEDKAASGIREYEKHWDGQIDVAVSPVDPRQLSQADLVLASAEDFRQLHVSRLCAELGIPCIYTIENTPKSRRDVVSIEVTNPLRRWRSFLWLSARETICRAFALASGLQANGLPAFKTYAELTTGFCSSHGCAGADLQISDRELDNRLSYSGPIRLVFSGRLIAIKGADQLIHVACLLEGMGIPFTLDVFGDGPIKIEIRPNPRAKVTYHGNVDFKSLMGFWRVRMPIYSSVAIRKVIRPAPIWKHSRAAFQSLAILMRR